MRLFYISFILFLSFCNTLAQADKADSLKSLLDTAQGHARYQIYNDLFHIYIKKDMPKAEEYAEMSYKLSKELDEPGFIGSSFAKIGNVHEYRGNYDSALIFYDTSLYYYDIAGNDKGMGGMYSSLGIVYSQLGEYEKSLDAQIKALRIFEHLSDSAEIAKILLNIGGIYYYWEQNERTVEYFSRALDIYQSVGNEFGVARCNSNLGSVYFEMGDVDNALTYSLKALDYYISKGYRLFEAILESNIANIYKTKGDYETALKYLLKTKEFYESQGGHGRLTYTYNNLGNLYMEIGQYSEAEKYLKKCLEFSEEIGNQEQVYEVYHSLSENAERSGNYREALKYFKQHATLKDSIFSENAHQQIAELETKYETEKKENRIKLQDVELERKEALLKKRQLEKTALSVISALVLFIAGIIWFRYREKQRTNQILAEKNKNITESISYARKIQTAVLPPEELVNNLLPEHFIYYLPRDIVSGDFYWVTRMQNKTIVAAADCTGHGVPGAFMSMLGFTLLNEIIGQAETLEANAILNELRNKVKKSLRQKGNEYEAQDGIDMALCIIDQPNRRVQYAGANNPVIIVRNGELKKIKGDKMPVGYQVVEKESFTNHEIAVEPNDMIYLFSDGYVDQFGGKHGHRFKAGPFEELLKSICHRSMKEQHDILEHKLLNWKGGYDQIDDILVMGVRIT
ncbi:MAG: tetratricopeptide repeat protein [Bacteroidota bacterium]